MSRIEEIARQVAGLVLRAVVRRVTEGGELRRVQVAEVGAEADDMNHLEPYGFTARPQDADSAGAPEALVLDPDGESIAILVGDRRYRLRTLLAGEVAIYDDQGQAVILRRDRVEVRGSRVDLGEGATLGVARLGDSVSATIPAGSFLVSSDPDVKNPAPVTISGEITSASGTVNAVD